MGNGVRKSVPKLIFTLLSDTVFKSAYPLLVSVQPSVIFLDRGVSLYYDDHTLADFTRKLASHSSLDFPKKKRSERFSCL